MKHRIRKLFSLLITGSMLLSLIPYAIITSSANETISKAEAQELVSKAFGFSEQVRGWTLAQESPIPDFDKPISVYVDSIDEYVMYYKVIAENMPGGSFEEMCKYAKTIYVNNVAPCAYKYSAGYGSLETQSNLLIFTNSSFYTYGKHRPLFYTDSEGLLYSAVESYQVGFAFALLDEDDEEQAIYGFNLTNNVVLEIISGDSNSATALVSFIWCSIDDTPPFDIQTVECKFVKTSDGWRIDESEFSILCATSSKDTLAAYRASVSPSTADPAFDSFVILPVISLACIIPAACLLRRRRRAAVN